MGKRGSGIGSRRLPFDAGTLTARLTDWPPTGHLREPKTDWPSEAFGHLHPHAPHRPIGTPSDGRPPHPRTFGSGGQRDGEGFSRAKCADTRVPVCPIPPLGTPSPSYPTD